MALVKVVGLDHVVVKCADVEASLAFSVDTLGLEPVRRTSLRILESSERGFLWVGRRSLIVRFVLMRSSWCSLSTRIRLTPPLLFIDQLGLQ